MGIDTAKLFHSFSRDEVCLFCSLRNLYIYKLRNSLICPTVGIQTDFNPNSVAMMCPHDYYIENVYFSVFLRNIVCHYTTVWERQDE